YRLYSGQQESGSVGIASRGNDGAITFRDWHPVAAEEYGYVVADPLDPDIVYGGKLSRFDRRTAQAQNILPLALRTPDFRMIRTQPVVFSPKDPHLLFFSGNTLWQTRDRGENWQQISPDLTRKTYDLPPTIGKYRNEKGAEAKQRGVIYTVAPSPLDVNRIWAGTDDGLIHLTSDGGKTWTDVTPPQISAWQKISIIDAGHFDANTAYAAVNTLRLDDMRPHIYRTTDGGKTWNEIVRGIPEGQTVNVVREDTQRKGLLFAGTERAVYYSLDEGENWQPLRLNMPATSIRDLIIKDDDVAVGTHGRGFWILDNITPLRQLSLGKDDAMLFKPQVALRVRWNMNTDTPLPPDEPTGENPPDGAMIDYQLPANFSGPVTLEIKDTKGNMVRRYASTDPLREADASKLKVPSYWVRPPQPLMATAGAHRFLWDLHYEAIAGVAPEFPIAAIFRNTAAVATGPWAMPGEYRVTLTAAGKSYTQPLTVKMDPRVKASPADLAMQFDLSSKLYQLRKQLEPIGKSFDALNDGLTSAKQQAGDTPVKEQLEAMTRRLTEFAPPNSRPGAPLSFAALDQVERLFRMIQDVDAAPTSRVRAAVPQVEREATDAVAKWQALIGTELPALNQQLSAAGIGAINPGQNDAK
ncbi:MAG: glycoside hydrolase, partial [Verrucomicrobiota bacterium]|nr:glycoside hydrolase [Verrucomicrobiota bacterium]